MFFSAVITDAPMVCLETTKSMSAFKSQTSSWERGVSPVRTIPLKTLLSFINHHRTVPIGAVFCYTHLKEETKKEDKTIEQPVKTSPMPSSSPVDEDFVPVEISLSNESISTATETATFLWSGLKASALKMTYHIKEKRISKLSESTKQNLDKNCVTCKKS